jgi:hypothetical protein
MSKPVLHDFCGKRFGMLTAVHVDHVSKRGAHWFCRCDCGRTKVVERSSLKAGLTRSCGCRQTAAMHEAVRTHGQSRSPMHVLWCAMIARCENPNNKSYSSYGGRGIKICRRWRDSFQAFALDMGPRPSPKHLLDRKDNDGNYEPGNCRWATQKESSRNRRGRLLITAFGETKCATAWVDDPRCACTYSALVQRIKILEWPPEWAVATPNNNRRFDK